MKIFGLAACGLLAVVLFAAALTGCMTGQAGTAASESTEAESATEEESQETVMLALGENGELIRKNAPQSGESADGASSGASESDFTDADGGKNPGEAVASGSEDSVTDESGAAMAGARSGESGGGAEDPGAADAAVSEVSDGVELSPADGEESVVEAAVPFNGHTVAIDAGHQAKANTSKEPIGPDSQTMKPKMPEGAVGVATGTKESDLTLEVARLLQAELENRGYEVVMIRDSGDVNLSSAERAAAANESGAQALISLHADSADNSSVYGALATCMTPQNPFHAELHDKSYNLSKKIVDHLCAATGTKNRGVQEVDNVGSVNWSEIPVSVVEMGFLSNPDEDRWLQSEEYRAKLVSGIAQALDSYFAEGN